MNEITSFFIFDFRLFSSLLCNTNQRRRTKVRKLSIFLLIFHWHNHQHTTHSLLSELSVIGENKTPKCLCCQDWFLLQVNYDTSFLWQQQMAQRLILHILDKLCVTYVRRGVLNFSYILPWHVNFQILRLLYTQDNVCDIHIKLQL